MSAARAAKGAGALLLTPGAGSDRNQPSLRAIEAAVAPLPVARIDFPYRREGRRAPDRADKLIACVVEEAASLAASAEVAPERIVLGGRSMGGRICSMAVAAGLPAAGLVLISYPLHPPGKPERLRTEHLPELRVPCLFVSGDRDAFGTPDELDGRDRHDPGSGHARVDPGRPPRPQRCRRDDRGRRRRLAREPARGAGPRRSSARVSARVLDVSLSPRSSPQQRTVLAGRFARSSPVASLLRDDGDGDAEREERGEVLDVLVAHADAALTTPVARCWMRRSCRGCRAGRARR